MLTIKNTQRKITLDIEALRQDVQKILNIINYSEFDLGIRITNNRTIRKYNKTYRNKNEPTDILSFPFYPNLKVGELIKAASEEEKDLGDIIISAEYIKDKADQLNVSLTSYVRKLLVHGICHLLGYDHIKDKDYRSMRAKEAYILKKLISN